MQRPHEITSTPKRLRCIGGPHDGESVEAKTTHWRVARLQDTQGATVVGTYVYDGEAEVYRWEDGIEPIIPA